MKAIPGWRVVLWAPRNTVKLVPVAGKRPAHPGKMVVSNSPSSVSPSLVRDIDYALPVGIMLNYTNQSPTILIFRRNKRRGLKLSNIA